MALSFEVKESDLLGRIGRLSVGGRSVETPYMFPVVHPVNQSVELSELAAMGFGGIMTNAYILYKRRREEALSAGLHRLLGFDGLMMTDSGGYQILEYGGVDADYADIAEFQSSMGSDLAVTLDRPTGYSLSRKYAAWTMERSLRDAVATMKEFGGRKTAWVGPVQGGLFRDLLRKSARGLVDSGFAMLALGSPVQVMENYRYDELVGMIVATRKAIPYSVPLHLFGAGHPHTMALAIALGCDTFDSASYVLFARQGRYMTERGVSRLREMKYLPCGCPVCFRETVGGLLELDERERSGRLAVHNLHVLRKELESCKEAISEGRLWDLVEERARAHPMLLRAFWKFVEASRMMEKGTPPMKEKGLFVRGDADHARPEVAIAGRRLEEALARGSRTAVLLNSDAPPVARLRPRRGAREGEFDLYRVQSEFGVVPAELDFVYPFTQTVRSGAEDGPSPADAARRLKKMGYGRVVVATVDSDGRVSMPATRSRRRKRAGAPYPGRSSSRLRSPRRP